jgi:kynureninase
VVACDTVSVNIFKCLHAALGLRPDRPVIVAEAGSFPTDVYVAEGVAAARPGVRLRLEGRDGAAIEDLIDPEVAAVLVNHVDYSSGEIRDVAAVTARAHSVGALAIWDLCHSAGVMPVGLNASAADMAVGCTYKYLNGGPGSPGFVFAALRHHAAIRQPLSGWWGHARPFAFAPSYQPAPASPSSCAGRSRSCRSGRWSRDWRWRQRQSSRRCAPRACG